MTVEPLARLASRVLLLDGADRVLLLQGWDPADPAVGHWWITPGGGLEDGEDPVTGALREVYEETGLRLDPDQLAGPVYEHSVEFSFDGRLCRQRQGYYVARCAPWTIDRSNLTELERTALGEARWWSLAELRETTETVYPAVLPGLLGRDPCRGPLRCCVRPVLWSVATAGSTPWNAPCAGGGSAGSPVRTRPAGVRVPARWWWPPRCCRRAGAARCPSWPTPSCSPRPTRDRVYDEVVARAEAYAVVVIPPGEVDARGLHRSNLDGMRRALARLSVAPDYVLTDGFGVDGLGVPGLAVWKGDQVAACIAAASVLAKVTRDRLMTELHRHHPVYDFAQHKGYITSSHSEALAAHGPCAEHRMSYVNVAAATPREAGAPAFDRGAFAAQLRRVRLQERPGTPFGVGVGNNDAVEGDEDMGEQDKGAAAFAEAGPRPAGRVRDGGSDERWTGPAGVSA